MITDKRPRGRPRGSGKNDTPFLALVADMLVRDPSMKPTTAMKRVIGTRKDWQSSDPTLVRRWQVKWKQQGEPLLTAARERARPRPSPPVQEVIGSIMAVHRQMERVVSNPDFQRVIAGMTAFNRQIERAVCGPDFKRMIEGIRPLNRQTEWAACFSDFQRMVANATAFERPTKEIQLVRPLNYLGVKYPR